MAELDDYKAWRWAQERAEGKADHAEWKRDTFHEHYGIHASSSDPVEQSALMVAHIALAEEAGRLQRELTKANETITAANDALSRLEGLAEEYDKPGTFTVAAQIRAELRGAE